MAPVSYNFTLREYNFTLRDLPNLPKKWVARDNHPTRNIVDIMRDKS